MTVMQRLTFDCGHFHLSGPWDGHMEDGRRRHVIGDLTVCRVCPMAKAWNDRSEWAIRQIVNVEVVPFGSYRKPDAGAERAWREQRHGEVR